MCSSDLILSPDSETNGRCPEVSSTAFRTQPPVLQPVPLMDRDSAIMARSPGGVCLRSGSCTAARTFAPRFFRTPPRDDALALRYDFTSIRLSRGFSPPELSSMLATQKTERSVAGALVDTAQICVLCSTLERVLHVSRALRPLTRPGPCEPVRPPPERRARSARIYPP